jgi:23S rRNA U2552 (ribose-2'-O)-methylase RlmE/FtsJ
MTQFSPIAKYDTYNERMSAGMLDKLFFVDKIDAQVIVDIGCADGTLIRYLHDWMTDTTSFIGYDNDPKMSHQAAFAFTRPEMIEKLGDTRIRSTVFWSEWKQVQSFVTEQKKQGKKSAVVMSSVIHEVHHYGQPQEIDEFWAGSKRVIRRLLPDKDGESFNSVLQRKFTAAIKRIVKNTKIR